MSIGFNVESDSNVTDESETHHAKQLAPRISTEAGIQIDRKEKHFANAQPEISINREPDSNVIDESRLHPPKHPAPMTSIVESNV
jgi:hypothetical protein